MYCEKHTDDGFIALEMSVVPELRPSVLGSGKKHFDENNSSDEG